MNNFTDVGDFHEKFDLPRTSSCRPQPDDNLAPELIPFRAKFLQEELDEFNEGREQGDHAQMFDALLDLVYVAMGTAHLLNYPWEAGWDAVQAANMAKVRTRNEADSKRGSSWDVVKPKGWVAPDIDAILYGGEDFS